MATHGYARWTDIQNDPKFAIINEPFRAMAAKQGIFVHFGRFGQRTRGHDRASLD